MLIIKIIFWVMLIGMLGTGSYFFYQSMTNYAKQYRQKTIDILEHIAQVFDLKTSHAPADFKIFTWDYPFITGEIKGNPILIYIETIRNGNDKDHRITIDINITSTLFFELYTNNLLNQGLFGSTPIDFKDPIFEEAFSVRATDIEIIQEVFNAELRQSLLANQPAFTGVRLICRNQKIQFSQSYIYPYMRDKDKFEALMQTLVLMLERVSDRH